MRNPGWMLPAIALTFAAASADARSRRADEPARDRAVPHEAVQAQISVCFVPAQACGAAIIDAIQSAQTQIRVQAYGFTAPSILNALALAQARGVDVQVILDRSNISGARGGTAFTAAANIPTWIDDTVAIAHNKVMIIDGALVIGGSYNYTSSAELRHAENVTFTWSADIARLFLDNWESRRAVSRALRPDAALTTIAGP